ncbi:MAG TPA: GerMN domain-containing protein [Acidimicrobiia bacterium]|nr:GerMN domain-containing protein [Acidimicrobiia bacterium]
MRRNSQGRRFLAVLAALALIITACGSDSGDTTSTSSTASTSTTTLPVTTTEGPEPSTTTTAGVTSTTQVEAVGHVVYFLLAELDEDDGSPGPFLVPVYREGPSTDEAALTALQLLVEGPTPDETAGTPTISTAIPEGTSVNGVTVEAGLATVDLSTEYDDGGGSFGMFARLAQVVFTLTRLPDIEGVAFSIDGEPVTVFSSEGIELDGPQQREDYYDLLPPIFVDSPVWGEPVTSPVQARGLSNVFEAVSQIMLTDDDGLPLFEETVMASCGTGCWGEWEVEIPFTVDRDQFGALIVWEISAQDGSQVNVREYPVQLR